MKFKKMFFLLIIVLIVNAIPSFPQQDPPAWDCCVLIYNTGSWNGWSTTLISGNLNRNWWADADTGLTTMIDDGVDSLNAAHASCSKMNMAWDDAKAKGKWLKQWKDYFIKKKNKNARKGLHGALKVTETWGQALKRQKYVYGLSQKRETNFDTCAEKYYRLGYTLGRATQSFRHATHDYSNGSQNWIQHLHYGKQWLQKTNTVMDEYARVRTGRCVDLEPVGVSETLYTLLHTAVSAKTLPVIKSTTDHLWKDIQQRLYNYCSGSLRPDALQKKKIIHKKKKEKKKKSYLQPSDFYGEKYIVHDQQTKKGWGSPNIDIGTVVLNRNGTIGGSLKISGRTIYPKGKWSFDVETWILRIKWNNISTMEGKVDNIYNIKIAGRKADGTQAYWYIFR